MTVIDSSLTTTTKWRSKRSSILDIPRSKKQQSDQEEGDKRRYSPQEGPVNATHTSGLTEVSVSLPAFPDKGG